MNADSKEAAFQQDITDQLVGGKPKLADTNKSIRLDQRPSLVHYIPKYWTNDWA